MATPQWNYIDSGIQGLGLAAPYIQMGQQGLANSLSSLQQLGREAEIANSRQNTLATVVNPVANAVGLVGRAVQPNVSSTTSGTSSPELKQGSGMVSRGTPSIEAAAPYRAMISEAAKAYGVPEDVILAVAQTESGFKPNAVSPTGVKGLMQVTQDTYRGLGFTGDRSDPTNSVNAGTKLLSQLYGQYGNWDDALAAYNGGADAVKGMRSGSWGIWANNPGKQREISNYARKVNSYRTGWS